MRFVLYFLLLIAAIIAVFFCRNIFLYQNPTHTAFVTDKTPFEEAFKRLENLGYVNFSKIENIDGLIVSHHMLASHLIAETLMTVAKPPKTILLISPNHFNIGYNKIQTTSYDWVTPYGRLVSDKALIKKIDSGTMAEEEQAVFQKEHGITTILPFIKKLFPQTSIVPLVIKNSLTEKEADEFIKSVSSMIPREVLIIGSFDFSHDSKPTVAEERDLVSVGILRENRFEEIYNKVHVDSKPGLYIFTKLMAGRASNFHLIKNTNSAVLTKNPNQVDTTSYILGFYK